MKTVEMSEATGPLSEYAERAHHETLIVTEGGKPVAALVPTLGEAAARVSWAFALGEAAALAAIVALALRPGRAPAR